MNPGSEMDVAIPTFGKALRPFSLVVALVSCGLGVALALQAGYGSGWRAFLIVACGLLVQAGVNLINDKADLPLLQGEALAPVRRKIKLYARWGFGCIAASGLVALGLSIDVGWSLGLLCLLGVIGAIGYTVEPLNYKRRGLGVPLVFWLMGVLMIIGAAHAMAMPLSWELFWLSWPVSMLVALLLLSNELRDWEKDCEQGILTLTVRIGYPSASKLFLLMLLATYLISLLLWQQGLLLRLWPLALSLVLLPGLVKLLAEPAERRLTLTPKTGRLLLVFGSLFGGCLVPF